MEFIINSAKYGKYKVLIDDEDREKVLSERWCVSRKASGFYVVNRRSGVYLHRLLTDAIKGQTVDHVNHNTLDNRKMNLRICTHAENIRNRKGKNKNNTSGAKGVFWAAWARRWRAQIKVNGRSKHLGYYENFLDAERAYNAAAIKHFGVFANCSGV